MTALSESPSSRDLFAGPMVQLLRENVIPTTRAADKWVPRMKRGMTGFDEVNL